MSTLPRTATRREIDVDTVARALVALQGERIECLQCLRQKHSGCNAVSFLKDKLNPAIRTLTDLLIEYADTLKAVESKPQQAWCPLCTRETLKGEVLCPACHMKREEKRQQ